MKTLIIHPLDGSTAFLRSVYLNIDDYTVENYSLSTRKFNQLCKDHDRIICMGHGNATGLFGIGRQEINYKRVNTLRGKELICIWCNSMGFALKYKLKGIFCDMIVSDMEEALDYNVQATQYLIDKSNTELALAFRLALILDSDNVYEGLKERYTSHPQAINHVVQFNVTNIHKVI